MIDATFVPPLPRNEPVLTYAPHTAERTALRAALHTIATEVRELPLWIDGHQVHTQEHRQVVMPHRHGHTLGRLHLGGAREVDRAIDASMRARHDWQRYDLAARAAIFLKAADLLTGPYRATINAATMLGQSKTPHQAEIDAACELADFLRFNVAFAAQIYAQQPQSSPGVHNRSDYRPLDGFVLAVGPFNFTAIGGNLATAPALMGNTVIYKPASTAALSSQVFMEVLHAAGLPRGVINLVHAPNEVMTEVVLKHHDLGGIHFTGSTGTFQHMWSVVGNNIKNYRAYPRLVGETGGKDFLVAHPSAEPEALAVAMVRGAFEYQGQKCSALSRAYLPASLYDDVCARVEAAVAALRVGDVADFSIFMGAVIDAKSFQRAQHYLSLADGRGARIWLGGRCNDAEGYFVDPTVVVADDPRHRLMREEIFGPVLSLYRYADDAFAQVLKLCDDATPYALTGAIFARDRDAVAQATRALRFSAGNFYINDKPTGAVVGQQPFGGSRASGTNDKAGSLLNLLRWTSPRTLKETFDPPRQVAYPYSQEDP